MNRRQLTTAANRSKRRLLSGETPEPQPSRRRFVEARLSSAVKTATAASMRAAAAGSEGVESSAGGMSSSGSGPASGAGSGTCCDEEPDSSGGDQRDGGRHHHPDAVRCQTSRPKRPVCGSFHHHSPDMVERDGGSTDGSTPGDGPSV